MSTRQRPMPNKVTGLPVGISRTTRRYKDSRRRPHDEFQVCFKDENGRRRIKHFYLPHDYTERQESEALGRAVAFREVYERREAKIASEKVQDRNHEAEQRRGSAPKTVSSKTNKERV